MGKKGSERRKTELGELSLNLNPMMDMFAVLIPALLMMSVVVEVSAVNISAPAIGGVDDPNKPPPEKPPLNFTVQILDSGFILTGAGLDLASGGPPDPGKPTIPIVQRPVGCSRYRNTVPPPRNKNKDQVPCDDKARDENKQFWVYDLAALHQAAVKLKEDNPEEFMVIVQPAANTDFEALSDVLEATRDGRAQDGTIRNLFPEVVISPGQ